MPLNKHNIVVCDFVRYQNGQKERGTAFVDATMSNALLIVDVNHTEVKDPWSYYLMHLSGCVSFILEPPKT
jgi:hypothetical protein